MNCFRTDTCSWKRAQAGVLGVGKHEPAAGAKYSCLPLCDTATTVPPTMRTDAANATLDFVSMTLRSSAPSVSLHAILATVMAASLPRTIDGVSRCQSVYVSCVPQARRNEHVAGRGCMSHNQGKLSVARTIAAAGSGMQGGSFDPLSGQRPRAHPAVMPATRRETGPVSTRSVAKLAFNSGTSKVHRSLAASSDTDRACKHRTQELVAAVQTANTRGKLRRAAADRCAEMLTSTTTVPRVAKRWLHGAACASNDRTQISTVRDTFDILRRTTLGS